MAPWQEPISDGRAPMDTSGPAPFLPDPTPPVAPPAPPSADSWLAGGLFSAIRGAFSRKPAPGSTGGSGGSGGPNKGPQIFVAGFGKHPGEEDHFDCGLATEQLSAIKRTLYINGIAGTLDSGEWDRLSPEERLPRFGHEFLWDRPNWVYCGRLWASRDAKGRARYPMIVCAQCGGVPRQSVLSAVPPVLTGLQATCQAAQSSGEVQERIEAAQATLREQVKSGSGVAESRGGGVGGNNSPAPPGGGSVTAYTTASAYNFLATHADLGSDNRGLLNLLYVIEKEMVGFRAGDDQRSFTTVLRMSRQIRLPACGKPPVEAADLWIAALRPLMHPATSMLGIGPVADALPAGEQRWIDLIIGEPTKDEIFALLASRKKLPLTTAIPYTLDDAFVQRTRRTIDTFRRNGVGPAA